MGEPAGGGSCAAGVLAAAESKQCSGGVDALLQNPVGYGALGGRVGGEGRDWEVGSVCMHVHLCVAAGSWFCMCSFAWCGYLQVLRVAPVKV